MKLEERLELIQQVGEEIVSIEELRALLEAKAHPVAYDGFEPSGQMHIAQGLLRTINVNKMTSAGIRFKMLVADWFAWMNNKLNGDIEKIRVTGKYFVEMWKACGMDTKNVEFVWSKDVVRQEKHWQTTVNIARHSTVNRILRTSQIMGRKSNESLSAAQIIYPCMQAADIFVLEADLCQLGMDQRKVNMLAREIGPAIGFWKPVVVSHHMILGLHEPKSSAVDEADKLLEIKMSKSKPDSAIFMTDSKEEVERKIMKAYCPEKQLQNNPIIEYCKYLVFEKNKKMRIERQAKFGGDLELASLAELEKAFVSGELHPMDLKKSVAFYLNEMLEPVGKHFEKGKAKELLEQVKGFEITR